MSTPVLYSRARGQRGAALAIGLIFLVVLSLSLVMAFRASVLQERMAGGFRNESLAEGAAESALRAGENWLWDWIQNNGNRSLRQGEEPFVRAPASIDPVAQAFRSNREWMADGAEYGDPDIANNTDGELAHQPRFQIEVIGEVPRSLEFPGGGNPLGPLVTHAGGAYAGSAGGAGGAAGIIEYYRITGRGAGGTDGVVRMLESTFTSTR